MADVVVVMGVSGAGKTTVGRRLAEVLGYAFVDADDLHPAANRAKMAAAQALSDDDRWPWLDAVAASVAGRGDTVLACSALKRAYRDRLRRTLPGARFVQLDVAPHVLEQRLRTREHEFMNPGLLDSQLATLEPLAVGEGVRVEARGEVDGEAGVEAAVRAVVRMLLT